MEKFEEIEKNIYSAGEFGKEVNLKKIKLMPFLFCHFQVFGLFRAPILTYWETKGLPLFLKNRFCGNSRVQLLYALIKCNILSQEAISKAIEISEKTA